MDKDKEKNANKSPTELLIKTLSKTTKVVLGVFSGMAATALVHPLDVVKVRMQVREKTISTSETMRLIVRCEGCRGLYSGLAAGLVRQATYTTTRLTTYHVLNEYYKKKQNLPNEVSLKNSEKVMIGICAGLAGAFAGNPAEVVLVRMMVDGPKLCERPDEPRRYRGVCDAFYRIATEEGIRALWRGGTLTLARSVAVSIAQIGTYAEVNGRLRNQKIVEGFPAHLITSLASSFVTTLLSLPIDLIKTRYQVRSDTITHPTIIRDILSRKGVRYFWKGISPYFIRMSIHTIATLVIFEYIAEKLYRAEYEKIKAKKLQ